VFTAWLSKILSGRNPLVGEEPVHGLQRGDLTGLLNEALTRSSFHRVGDREQSSVEPLVTQGNA
jgi:hypothetical protein